MERVNRIWKHPMFQMYMQDIQKAEEGRLYCLHDAEHCFDVARIGYIINLEEKLGFEKDIIYAMALLHDIGRREEYASGRSHHAAGAELAEPILKDAGYLPEEREAICEAISRHKASEGACTSLSCLLYEADKRSRRCFDCVATDSCYWSEEKKNFNVTI